MRHLIFLSIIIFFLVGCQSGGESFPDFKSLPKITDLNVAKTILADKLKVGVRSYSTFDFGREKDLGNISIIVPEQYAREKIGLIQESLSDSLGAFIGTTRWLGEETHSGVEIVVTQVTNKLDILKVSRSDAINYDMQTEDLIKKLSEFDKALSINIFHAETDTIEFTYKKSPVSYPGLAKQIFEFCPDVVHQGVGSLEELEISLRVQKTVYLWWD